ncbi:MAG: adenylate/guanylate cyclase domain-containing protein [Deltaproteobacteria bacterium]|nr:adenylate/guanylate cyclase domain-containing protein [Deltaproteobacteria bacterium]
MDTMFLQEIEATVVTHDVKGFGVLAAQLGPVEMGAELGRFYEHVADHVTAEGGRVVKFVGDAVLSVFLGKKDHRTAALRAVLRSLQSRDSWLTESADAGRPLLDYTVGASAGPVLAGDVGIPKLRSYDVLGRPVNFAFRLCTLAVSRGTTHLVTAGVYEGAHDPPPGIEVEGVEFAGKALRLFRLEV